LLDALLEIVPFIFSDSQESIDNKGTRRVVFRLIFWTKLSFRSIVRTTTLETEYLHVPNKAMMVCHGLPHTFSLRLLLLH
jgi:hypothetical protein